MSTLGRLAALMLPGRCGGRFHRPDKSIRAMERQCSWPRRGVHDLGIYTGRRLPYLWRSSPTERQPREPETPPSLGPRRPLTGRLVLADGTVISRAGARRHRLGRGRGVLQHRHHRLPGDPDRPVLRRPDHHVYLPAHRQRRRQPGGHRDLQSGHALGRARLRAARAGDGARQLPRGGAARTTGSRRAASSPHRGGYPRPGRPHPREGHAQRRHRPRALRRVRPGPAAARGQGLAGA